MYYWKENIFRQNEIPHLLKILLSLPFSYLPWNHFSDEHEWFLKSVAREEPYTDYYVWKDPAGYDENGNPLPPNNWVNCSVYVCRQSKGIRKTKTLWLCISIFSQVHMYIYKLTHPISEIIWVKNVRAIVVCGFLMKSLKNHILKISTQIGLNWLCYLAGNSQTAPTILFKFSGCV